MLAIEASLRVAVMLYTAEPCKVHAEVSLVVAFSSELRVLG